MGAHPNERPTLLLRPLFSSETTPCISPCKGTLSQGPPLLKTGGGGGDGGGFILACEVFGKCLTVHSQPFTFFFFNVEISSRTLIPLFTPGSVHSGSAS